ncbi:MAG: EAL domain-containing protein [Hyphomicrobiaceae bacterium]
MGASENKPGLIGHEAEPAASVVGPDGLARVRRPLKSVAALAEPVEPNAAHPLSESFDLVGILSSIEETAYRWDLKSDVMAWERNARHVLRIQDEGTIATGRGFNFLIAPEHFQRRLDALSRESGEDLGQGVPFRIQYRFGAGGRRDQTQMVWLEDHGRWWADESGNPARVRGVIRVIDDRYREEQRLLYRSDHDELTGQLNRVRLTEALGAVISRSEASGQSSAFLVAAVNNLAVINQTFGFEVGDEVIATVARTIRGRLRGGDQIGRYSSNKFGIILHECGPGAMQIAAERFMRAVRETTVHAKSCPLSVTISIGGVLVPSQADSVNGAVGLALQALDAAKLRRSDSFVAYEASSTRETARHRNIAIADEIVTALEQQRMLLMLQPIVCSKTRKPVHFECLLRMERTDGTVVSAGEFIAVAEQLGLSRLIDQRVLELAVDLLRRHPKLSLAVNVSGLTSSDHEWLVALHRLTGGRRELTNRLIIEITETAAIHDLDQSIAFVDTLKELGCKVAIDDFGAGYTSFKNLKHLAVDMVKIDGAFVRDLTEDATDQVFIRTLADLATTCGMETVAEWVGDVETAAFIEAAGITYMQGFLFSEPVKADEITRLFPDSV